MNNSLKMYNEINEAKEILEKQMHCFEGEHKCFGCCFFKKSDAFCVQWNSIVPDEASKLGCEEFNNVPF